MKMSAEYQRAYRAQISRMRSIRLFVTQTNGYIPPRVKTTYRERPRRGWSGNVFRMASFSGDPNLCLRPRR